MNHWYVYHSQKTMKCTYASLGASAVYSTTNQSKLGIGDVIWVVEGDESSPVQFELVDCFRAGVPDYPPFPIGFPKFKLKVSGTSLLISGSIPLSKSSGWFELMHRTLITKQRFFAQLDDSGGIIDGLEKASGITI